MLSQEEKTLARECLEMALECGAQKARVSFNKSSMDMVATLNGEVDKVTSCLDSSLEICLFVDGRFGSFSTNRTEKESLRGFISRAVRTVRMLAPDPCRDLPAPERVAKNAVTGRELAIYDPAILGMTAERRRQLALDAAVASSEGKGWKTVSEEGEYSDSCELSYIVDSQGLEALQCETCFDYGVETTIEDSAGDKYSAYWWTSSPFLSKFDASTCGKTALERAVAKIHPKRVRSGKYNMVVFEDVASKMVSPILNALGGYSVQQNNSFLMDSIGKQLFPKGMNLVDRPHIKGNTGSRLFDSEGVATKEHDIIREGVVQEFFLNTFTAAKLGMEPTVESAIRPALLPFSPAGPVPSGMGVDEILKLCGKGIFVTDFNGGNSNSATGDFSYGIEGFWFEDGKILKPVSEMLVTGNFITLWNNLLAAGDDSRQCKSKLIPTIAFKDVDFSG